jgi:putative toxin-antitoxin system antitoxin component (TIGR02293 family)
MNETKSIKRKPKDPSRFHAWKPPNELAAIGINKNQFSNWSIEIPHQIREIKDGYPIDKFDRLKNVFGVSQEALSRVSSISLPTIHRRKLAKHFNSDESDKIYRLERLYKTALEVLESKDYVKAWFNMPLKIFEGKTPFEYADTVPGSEEVERVLRRIEQGIVL